MAGRWWHRGGLAWRFAEDGAGDGEGDGGARRHEDGGEEGVHHAGEGKKDGGEVVEKGEGKDAAHGTTSTMGDVEQGGDEAQAVAEEVEVGFVFEEVSAGDGAAGAEGGFDGEAVVGSVADEKGVELVEAVDALGFVLWGHLTVPVGGRDVEGAGD